MAVPTARLQAMQLRVAEQWPEDGLYRVRTSWGDDFLVDPEATRIVVDNELGPLRSVPVGVSVGGADLGSLGDWRVELTAGTVLIGPLETEEITFALPMGPDQIVVPLTALVALERGAWSVHDVHAAPAEAVRASPRRRPARGVLGGLVEEVFDEAAEVLADPAPAQAVAPAPVVAEPGLSSQDGLVHELQPRVRQAAVSRGRQGRCPSEGWQ